jgi:branched-chain amino acid transport system substrate-binding protein
MRLLVRGSRCAAICRGAESLLLFVAGLAASCGNASAPQLTGSTGAVGGVAPVLLSAPRGGFDGRVSIATVFPAIGRYGLSGVQSTNGARLAVEELNRAGPIHGRELGILEYRTGSYFVDARHAADLAIAAGAVAIVGSNSSTLSMAIAERAEAAGIVQISNISTAQDLTWDPVTGRDRRFIFRVCGPDVEIGALLAGFARDQLNADRVAVLYEIGRTYSAKLARVFVDSFRDVSGPHVTREFPYVAQETDFRATIKAIAAFRPDVVFIPGSFADGTLVAVQSRGLGLSATLLGADGWSNRLLFSRGAPMGTAYYGDLCFTPDGFRRRYRLRFGEEPDGCRAVLAYDAVQALGAALQGVGPLSDEDLTSALPGTRDRIRQAVAAVNVRGEVGRMRFDEHGDIRRGIAVMRVEDTGAGALETRLHRWLGER